RRTISRDAVGRRLEVLFRAARPLWPRREGPRLLEDRPLGDRADDRRTGGNGGRDQHCALNQGQAIDRVAPSTSDIAARQSGFQGRIRGSRSSCCDRLRAMTFGEGIAHARKREAENDPAVCRWRYYLARV